MNSLILRLLNLFLRALELTSEKHKIVAFVDEKYEHKLWEPFLHQKILDGKAILKIMSLKTFLDKDFDALICLL